MAKDAKGHGSDARGGAVRNYADVMKRNPGYGNLRAKGDAFNAVHPDDRQAALALANGHPKADAAPVHGGMRGGPYKVQSLNTKLAGKSWRTEKGYGRRAVAERVAQHMRTDGGYTRVRRK